MSVLMPFLPGIGGQTGLNLAMQLEKGILAECRVELLGTKSSSIERAEDREMFKEFCESLGEPVLPSDIASSMEEGLQVTQKISYPLYFVLHSLLEVQAVALPTTRLNSYR